MAFAEQLALAFAAHGERLARRRHARDRAHKAAGALVFVLHVAEQEGVAFLVRARAVARGIDARRAVQRVHAQAAVIRNRGQAGEVRCAARLDHGVFLKGRAGFLGFGRVFRQRDDLNAQTAQNGRHFGHLFLVMGGEYELHHRLSPITRLCALHRRAQPRLPKPSSFFSSLSENGRPSPVPCTSINCPAEVITTLQSTIAWLSSA